MRAIPPTVLVALLVPLLLAGAWGGSRPLRPRGGEDPVRRDGHSLVRHRRSQHHHPGRRPVRHAVRNAVPPEDDEKGKRPALVRETARLCRIDRRDERAAGARPSPFSPPPLPSEPLFRTFCVLLI